MVGHRVSQLTLQPPGLASYARGPVSVRGEPVPQPDREQLERLIDLLPAEDLPAAQRLLLGLIALDRNPSVAVLLASEAHPPAVPWREPTPPRTTRLPAAGRRPTGPSGLCSTFSRTTEALARPMCPHCTEVLACGAPGPGISASCN